jgi:hypothetical protein
LFAERHDIIEEAEEERRNLISPSKVRQLVFPNANLS